MTWEIAEKAVESFFERLMDDYGVSFYGGEPLLALNLIKRVIHLVEEKGRNLDGKRGSFNITTNGTLLDDDTIHFLVQHNVNVLISLDGPKEFHDRYRVFHDATGKKKGTFDVVMKNLERFVELYPTYHLRGINLVLAPPIGFDETNAFLRDLVPHFPVSRVSFLQPCHRHASHNDGSSFHVGCGPTQCAQCPAGWFTCGKLPDGNGNGALQASQNASRASSVIGRDTRAESSAPAFASWSVATKREYGVWLRRYVDCVKEKGPRQASFEFPLIHQLLLASLFSVHLRPLTKSVEQTSYLRCLPGYPRLFCTTSGDYYPCERGPTNNTSRLGNVRTGLDPQASIRLVRLLQTMTDCGNCFAARFCGICPVNIHESDGPTGWDGAAMQHNCHEAQHFLGDLLVIYTEILENRPSAFDELMDSGQLEAILAMSLNVLPAPEESRTAASVERLIENKMLW
jgi:radical SAM protein with 4Fe4S-binding SPASM domain